MLIEAYLIHVRPEKAPPAYFCSTDGFRYFSLSRRDAMRIEDRELAIEAVRQMVIQRPRGQRQIFQVIRELDDKVIYNVETDY